MASSHSWSGEFDLLGRGDHTFLNPGLENGIPVLQQEIKYHNKVIRTKRPIVDFFQGPGQPPSLSESRTAPRELADPSQSDTQPPSDHKSHESEIQQAARPES
ncbi:hypothetical protein VZT92_026569 [Zoarces viviparus]|uniref:Uncharacterized protein n=1 Tax=Zoarces viviparus TaxID=48416 RepID=A0AAW1E1E2_ZOAVI